MTTVTHRWIALLLAGVLMAGMASSQSRSRRDPSDADFSYYMLVLSYAPDFCDQPTGRKDPRECGKGNRLGFIVHGLWPQGENSRGPEDCGSARPVSQAIIRLMLSYIPSESLIQHEWTNHGTCSGMSSDDYFAAIRKARASVTVPADLAGPDRTMQLSPAQIEAKFASANPRFPAAAFRTSCYRNGELEEVRVCLNKDLSPRPCGSSAGECRTGNLTVLPVH